MCARLHAAAESWVVCQVFVIGLKGSEKRKKAHTKRWATKQKLSQSLRLLITWDTKREENFDIFSVGAHEEHAPSLSPCFHDSHEFPLGHIKGKAMKMFTNSFWFSLGKLSRRGVPLRFKRGITIALRIYFGGNISIKVRRVKLVN